MALESLRPSAPTLYYQFKDPKPEFTKSRKINEGTNITGYYLRKFTKELDNGPQTNYVLVDLEGTHHVVPGSKALNADMVEYAVQGALISLTYKGKNKFKYTDPKDGKEKTAAEHKWTVQQDRADIRSFTGPQYAETVGEKLHSPPITAEDVKREFSSSDIPF